MGIDSWSKFAVDGSLILAEALKILPFHPRFKVD